MHTWCMSRTKVDIDDEACADIMHRYGLSTKSESINLALRTLADKPLSIDEARRLRGLGGRPRRGAAFPRTVIMLHRNFARPNRPTAPSTWRGQRPDINDLMPTLSFTVSGALYDVECSQLLFSAAIGGGNWSQPRPSSPRLTSSEPGHRIKFGSCGPIASSTPRTYT